MLNSPAHSFMNILLLQTGEPIPSDVVNLRPMRASILTNALLQRGHNVHLISSRFFHQVRKKRTRESQVDCNTRGLRITLIDSPGYSINVGIARLIDHSLMAFSLAVTLFSKKEKPDVIFIGYPPIETAYILAVWAVMRGIPYMLDVKDFWPDTIRSRLSFLPTYIASFILLPYECMASFVTKHASSLCSISPEALNYWNHKYSREASCLDTIGYLSSSFTPQELVLDPAEHRRSTTFIYAGSLTAQLSLDHMFSAFSAVQDNECSNRLLIIGDGPYKDVITKLSNRIQGIRLLGWRNQHEMAQFLRSGSAVIIPYKSTTDFRLSIPNKAFDALMFNLPIISTLQGALSRLLTTEGVGYSISDEVEAWTVAFKSVVNRDKYYDTCKHNIHRVRARYATQSIYSEIVCRLEKLPSRSL